MPTFHEFKTIDGTPTYMVTCDYTGETTSSYLALPKRAPAMFRGKYFANLMALLGFYWSTIATFKNNATNAKRTATASKWILEGFYGGELAEVPIDNVFYRESLIRFGGVLDFHVWASQWTPVAPHDSPCFNYQPVSKKMYTDWRAKLAGKFKSNVTSSAQSQKEATLDTLTVYPVQQEITPIQSSYDRLKFPHTISELVGNDFSGRITDGDVYIASADPDQPANVNAQQMLQEKGVLGTGQAVKGPLIAFKKNRKAPRTKASNSTPKSGNRIIKPKSGTKTTKKLSARVVGSGLARANAAAKVSKKRTQTAPTAMEINKTPSVIV